MLMPIKTCKEIRAIKNKEKSIMKKVEGKKENEGKKVQRKIT